MILFIDSTQPQLRLMVSDKNNTAAELYLRVPRSRYSEIILPNIDNLLHKLEASVKGLKAVSVNLGPGSFTGTRIGVSIAKSLAGGLKIPLIGVNTMELLTFPILMNFHERFFISVLDAKRGEIFTSVYDKEEEKWVQEPELWSPENFSERLKEFKNGVIFGSGAAQYKELEGVRFICRNESLISRETVPFIYEKFGKSEFVKPGEAEPLYIRKSDAELTKKKESSFT